MNRPVPMTDAQRDLIRQQAEGLFADAIAQGMHAPSALDAEYWGREYATRLLFGIDVALDAQRRMGIVWAGGDW